MSLSLAFRIRNFSNPELTLINWQSAEWSTMNIKMTWMAIMTTNSLASNAKHHHWFNSLPSIKWYTNRWVLLQKTTVNHWVSKDISCYIYRGINWGAICSQLSRCIISVHGRMWYWQNRIFDPGSTAYAIQSMAVETIKWKHTVTFQIKNGCCGHEEPWIHWNAIGEVHSLNAQPIIELQNSRWANGTGFSEGWYWASDAGGLFGLAEVWVGKNFEVFEWRAKYLHSVIEIIFSASSACWSSDS